MKKLLLISIVLVSSFCLAFSFAGCKDGEENTQTEIKGYLCDLQYAAERSLIDEFDLESVADCYYKWRGFADNPYEGKFNSSKELSEEMANVIKKGYLSERTPYDEPTEGIKIIKYFGTYANNVVIAFDNEAEKLIPKDRTIEGVVFRDFQRKISVFHIPDQPPEERVEGKLYDLKTAYEKGFLSESHLKSISCCRYETYCGISANTKNPYSGLYQRPMENLSYENKREIRKAYSEQIDTLNSKFDNVVIYKYIGIYNGNTVVVIGGEGCVFPSDEDVQIGNVKFYKGSSLGIYVYCK